MPTIASDPVSQARSQGWPDELVSELAITAAAIGIDEKELAAALGDGKTVADVAAAHGVSVRRVIIALVSVAGQEGAAHVRPGVPSPRHVRWLVPLATH